jgi:transposase-like protein
MEFEIEQRTGAAYGERTGDRTNSRNGYRERLWATRAGSTRAGDSSFPAR